MSRFPLCLIALGVLSLLAVLLAGPVLAPSPAESAFPGANGKIAFHSDRDGNREIYAMNSDGSGQANVTNNPADDSGPGWSADGTKIAFTRGVHTFGDIYLMNADGTGQTNLTNNPLSLNAGPTWSPDGTKIAFDSNRDGNAEVYVMNADGSGQTNLTNNPAGDLSPDWSPDGTKIVFESGRDGNREIYVMSPDGSGQTRLTYDASFDGGPAWSADGTKVAFASLRDGNYEVYVMNADGSGQTRFTNNLADDFGAVWSPDGSKIAFTSRRDGNYEVYVMNADGSGQTNLTNNSGFENGPDWQPLVPPAVITVVIDIKPGSDWNPVNLGSGGVIPVAILATSSFDAATVDPSSVCFGDADSPAEPDCSEAHARGHVGDVDRDGDLDLLLHYEMGQTGIDPGDTQACLTGQTWGGTPIEDCDVVRTR